MDERKRRRIITIIFAIPVLAVLVISLPFIGYRVHLYMDVQQNKKAITAYLEEKYDGDYEIIREFFGSSGAAGRHDDFLEIQHNGHVYEIRARGGVITQVMEHISEDGIVIEIRDITQESVSPFAE